MLSGLVHKRKQSEPVKCRKVTTWPAVDVQAERQPFTATAACAVLTRLISKTLKSPLWLFQLEAKRQRTLLTLCCVLQAKACGCEGLPAAQCLDQDLPG